MPWSKHGVYGLWSPHHNSIWGGSSLSKKTSVHIGQWRFFLTPHRWFVTVKPSHCKFEGINRQWQFITTSKQFSILISGSWLVSQIHLTKKRRDKGSKTMFYSNENHALSLNIMYGWWLTYPSEKYESQLGWWFPIYTYIWKIKAMFQTNNQSETFISTI